MDLGDLSSGLMHKTNLVHETSKDSTQFNFIITLNIST